MGSLGLIALFDNHAKLKLSVEERQYSTKVNCIGFTSAVEMNYNKKNHQS